MFHSHEVEVLAGRRQTQAIHDAERERELRAAGVERPLFGLPSPLALVAHVLRGRRLRLRLRRREPAVLDAAPRLKAARP